MSAVLFFCTASLAAPADERRDHEHARQAVNAGEVLPLRTILDQVERSHPGQVIDVGLEREQGSGSNREGGKESTKDRWVYKLKILRPGGALLKLRVDARTGAVLGSRGTDQASGEGGGGAHSGR